MRKEDETILEDFCLTRNITNIHTIRNYKQAIKNYTESQGLNMQQLLEEAETEEEKGIRLKHRTLKKRIIIFQNYLLNEKGLSRGTLDKQVQNIKTIYHHYEIELPKIPAFNDNQIRDYEPIYYDDLPTKEMIQEALKLSMSNMRAIILFICSSGCAREETLSLTIQDFIEATSEYHNQENIPDVLYELKTSDANIIPTFKLKRRKTNQYYYTFCSPEAVDAIIAYLYSRDDKLLPEKQLFKMDKNYFIRRFNHLNQKLGNHTKGAYGIFRSHNLRKFHASNLARGENGLSISEIDSLQGRGKTKVHTSYFLDDPQELKKKYIANIDKVLINYDNITIESPEVLSLKQKALALEKENEKIKQNINKAVDDRINEVLQKYGF